MLIEPTEQFTEQLALAEIGRIVSSSLNIDDIYEGFADAVAKLVPFDSIAIAMIDVKLGIVTLSYMTGKDWATHQTGDQVPLANLDGSLLGAAIESKSSKLIQGSDREDLIGQFSTLSRAVDAGFRSFMLVPIISNDLVIGALTLRSTKWNAYEDQQVQTVERIAIQITGALANVQLHSELARESNERETLAAIGRLINSSLNIDEMYETFADQVRKLVPFDSIGFGLADPETGVGRLTSRIGDGFHPQASRQGFVVPGSPMEKMLETKDSILIQSSDSQDTIERFPALAQAIESGHRSFISVPLISNDLVIGGLTLRSKRRNAYTFDQLRTVERIGNQIAGAVANAGLHAELSSDSEQREALAEIGRIVSSSLDMDEVYGRFEHETKKLVPFDSLGIVTVDIERGMGWSAYRSGENWLALRAAEEYSLAGSPLEYAIETNSSVLIQGSEIEDMVARFPILSLATGVGYRSFITVPLTSNNVAIGGLSVRSLKWNAYANEHVEIVERVANQISGAIANAQLHYALARESSERDILAEIGRIMSS
ncbi:MAG: GAF domain-containing protein, partial [SAR202 cluster bacterium]|nr:GAF domain-containing protein [SAR202 cluster bacterium]